MRPVVDPIWWTTAAYQGQPLVKALALHDFATVFAFLRQRGWSISAIAGATGLEENRVREVLRGRRRVTSYEVIERITTGLSVDRHLCGVGTAPSQPNGMVSPFDHEAAEVCDWLAQARCVDASVLTALGEQADQIRRIDRMLGAHAAQQQLQGYLTTLGQLRAFCLSPAIRQRLAELICDAAALAGWVALDLGQVAQAWSFHEQAKDAGRETGSVAALVHALAQQAYVLLELGKIADARGLAEQAVTLAGSSVPPVLRAWLRAVVGELAAVDGDGAASLRAFDQAQQWLPGDARDPMVPYVMLDAYQLARWRGTASARLGDEHAIGHLQYALGGMDASFVRARAQLHVELTHALITAGHRDEALRQLDQAATLTARVGSVRQRRRVNALRLGLHHAGGEHAQQAHQGS